MDEAHTQALETRRRNAEARKQWREAQEAERKQDEALVLSALRVVLQDPETSASERLFAVAVLDRMKYYNFILHEMKYKRNDDLIKDFAQRLAAAQKTEIK